MDQVGYQTPWWLFLGIVTGYVVLSLVVGGKKTYFEPYAELAEEVEATPKPQT